LAVAIESLSAHLFLRCQVFPTLWFVGEKHENRWEFELAKEMFLAHNIAFSLQKFLHESDSGLITIVVTGSESLRVLADLFPD